MSDGKFAGKFSRRDAVHSYRSRFAETWAAMLRANFESPEEVAVVWRVEGSTARKWWAGEHAPAGAAVGIAFAIMPEEAQRHLGSV